MLKILYLIDKMQPGGTELQLLQLISGLDRNQFQPHLCVLNLPGGKLYDQLDIPKFSLSFRRFSHPSIIRDIRQLTTYIRRNQIDIVQTFFQDSTLLAALTKPFHRAKLIGSFRDLGFWRRPSENLKMRLAYPMYTGFIANSQSVKQQVVKVDGIDSEKIQVIYNGFDSSRLEQFRVCPVDPPCVGIVANLNRPVKRVQDFIKAAALINSAKSEVRFCVVGGGYLHPELERLAATLGIADLVEFTGFIDDPLQKIATWRVGVITSESEGFCNAIIEYMACGLPVVATDVGGNSELIVEEINGYLVPSDKVDVLAAKIVFLLNNDHLCSGIEKRNTEKVAQQFSVKSMIEHQSNYYQKL